MGIDGAMPSRLNFVVPMELVDFSLIGPVFGICDQTVAYRIIANIIPASAVMFPMP